MVSLWSAKPNQSKLTVDFESAYLDKRLWPLTFFTLTTSQKFSTRHILLRFPHKFNFWSLFPHLRLINHLICQFLILFSSSYMGKNLLIVLHHYVIFNDFFQVVRVIYSCVGVSFDKTNFTYNWEILSGF